MSFSYNPYQHIEVLHKEHGNYQLHCPSCGKQWGDWTGTVPARHLFKEVADHVRLSHARTREDFDGWSQT
jgi:hypothetical protein